jgi:methane/ammonia monooxygenase subunit B
VFVKVATYLNEVPMMQSTHLEYGREYEFRIVAKARTPGRHHVHPMLNVESAGPLLGPGKWIEVTGNAADFVIPLQTLDGIAIPNLENWQLGHVLRVQAYWIVVALAWLAWWFRGAPPLLERFRVIGSGHEEKLFSKPIVRRAGPRSSSPSASPTEWSPQQQVPRTGAEGGRVRSTRSFDRDR